MTNNPISACMRTPEAAHYLDLAISKSRLTQLRMTGDGPPFVKVVRERWLIARWTSMHGLRAMCADQHRMLHLSSKDGNLLLSTGRPL